jgi:L-alanine-DL-glutamate epimerase-like enolase superfamily enzyme
MSHFELQWQIVPLKLKEVFTISRSSRSEVPVVILRISKDGITGYGEASPNARYQESPDSVRSFFKNIPDGFLDEIVTPKELPDKLNKINHTPVYSAKAALEMAWLDWWAKSNGKPLWHLLDYASPVGPETSYTIGIDTPEKMQQKIQAASEYPIYKIKLGTDTDREIITAIREVTDKPLRIDANEGWKTLEQAKSEIDFLTKQNIELIEQPMPASEFRQMKKLKKWSPLPLCADESFTGAENIEDVAKAFHIINIKLMKIGSLIRAREVIQKAKKTGLQVMIGCMIESSLANTAGAMIALEANYADLDGHLLISNDPFTGLQLNNEFKIQLTDKPGIGVEFHS